MNKLKFGRNKQLVFETENDLFYFIGILTSGKYTSIHWERNELQNAWGSEGRIHIYNDVDIFPQGVRDSFTAGTGRILFRVNCNEFVHFLYKNHQFVNVTDSTDNPGRVLEYRAKSYDDVLITIPNNYKYDFINGYKA
ncbi:hypothetical protein PT077_08600 [Erysipelothrix rhusiopathiae]|nr:hypothetical protein [Erysipelothrix rhusiopathiae]